MPGVKKLEVEQRRKPSALPWPQMPIPVVLSEVPPFSSDAPFSLPYFLDLHPGNCLLLHCSSPQIGLPASGLPIAIPSPVDHWMIFQNKWITSVPWFQGLPWFPITLRRNQSTSCHRRPFTVRHLSILVVLFPRMCSWTRYASVLWNHMEFPWPVFLLTLCFLPDSYLPFKIQTWHLFPQEAPLDIPPQPSLSQMHLMLCFSSLSIWLSPPISSKVFEIRESVSLIFYHKTQYMTIM